MSEWAQGYTQHLMIYILLKLNSRLHLVMQRSAMVAEERGCGKKEVEEDQRMVEKGARGNTYCNFVTGDWATREKLIMYKQRGDGGAHWGWGVEAIVEQPCLKWFQIWELRTCGSLRLSSGRFLIMSTIKAKAHRHLLSLSFHIRLSPISMNYFKQPSSSAAATRLAFTNPIYYFMSFSLLLKKSNCFFVFMICPAGWMKHCHFPHHWFKNSNSFQVDLSYPCNLCVTCKLHWRDGYVTQY